MTPVEPTDLRFEATDYFAEVRGPDEVLISLHALLVNRADPHHARTAYLSLPADVARALALDILAMTSPATAFEADRVVQYGSRRTQH